jgi:hypothetical protein
MKPITTKTKSNKPNSRWGWHKHYVKRFNQTGSEHAEQMACWYLLLHYQHDVSDIDLQALF